MTLSVCIITLNEEDNLPRCLASVRELADQIVVVDSLSTDSTRELAAAAGAEVIEQEFLGHVRQKQLALERATCDWVLCLDADEWLDEDLAAAVSLAVGGEPAEGRPGFEVNRRTRYLGAWIDHCGWSPEWRLRLVRRDTARWEGTDPHDRLVSVGELGRLTGRLNHRPYRSLADHLDRVNRYTDIMAARRFEAGKRASWIQLLLHPPGRFLRMYVLRGGFLDGWRGLIVSAMGCFYVYLKYVKLWELTRTADDPDDAAVG